jgi:adenylate cyclase
VSLLSELKRRRVVRAGLVYSAAAFASIQAVDALSSALNLPDWIVRVVAIIAVAGLPVAIVLAWIFEFSADGLRVTDDDGGATMSVRWLDKRTIIAAIVLLVTGVAVGLAVRPRGTTSEQRTIAVLPFSNLSDSKENEFFSDGITEDIISQLALLADLAVTSRTSVMQYKKSDLGARAIADQLGVAHILEGSVRREGRKVRIVAQLIEAKTDRHLWTQTFDRDLEDVFAMQSEVAREIASALHAALSPRERVQLARVGTRDSTAYLLFSRARALNYGSREDNATAIELLRQAIARDSNFVDAWVLLSTNFTQRTEVHGLPPGWLDSATVAARRAIAIDSMHGGGYRVLSHIYMVRGDLDEARRQVERGLALQPGDVRAMGMRSTIAYFQGDLVTAIKWGLEGFRRDPRSPSIAHDVASGYMDLGNLDDADRWHEKSLELDPDYVWALATRTLLRAAQGRAAEADSLAKTWLRKEPNHPIALFVTLLTAGQVGDWKTAREIADKLLREAPESVYADHRPWAAEALRHTGERARSDSILDVVIRDAQRDSRPAGLRHQAEAYIVRGDLPKVMEMLEQYQARGGYISPEQMLNGPRHQPLLKEPRYQRIVERARVQQKELRARLATEVPKQ